MARPSAERPGRPRDPGVDSRVQVAAMELFASQGWAGFSIDAVARASGVSKASIYLRWSSKEDLLTQAVAENFSETAAIDTGDVRSDLLALVRLLLDLFEGRHGLAARRMTIESRVTPGVAERWAAVRASQVRAARGIVRRAIARGELPRGTSVSLVLDTLCGAAINRANAIPDHLRDRAERTRPAYAEQLVDLVLTGARALGDAHPT
jgi:AcrR family transcriptional regulator